MKCTGNPFLQRIFAVCATGMMFTCLTNGDEVALHKMPRSNVVEINGIRIQLRSRDGQLCFYDPTKAGSDINIRFKNGEGEFITAEGISAVDRIVIARWKSRSLVVCLRMKIENKLKFACVTIDDAGAQVSSGKIRGYYSDIIVTDKDIYVQAISADLQGDAITILFGRFGPGEAADGAGVLTEGLIFRHSCPAPSTEGGDIYKLNKGIDGSKRY